MEAPNIIREISRSLVEADWSDPLSTVGLFQAIYRLFAFGNKDYYVLHGSAALTSRGTTVMFGDDGRSTRGKTVCAVELALASQLFVCDEYVLFQVESGQVFANPHRPIHFKGITANHLKMVHNVDVGNQALVSPGALFQLVDKSILSLIVIPRLVSTLRFTSNLEEVGGQERLEILRACAFGHLAKLVNPELDRSSLITRAYRDCAVNMEEVLSSFPLVDLSVRLYRANLAVPCDIVPLLEKEGY